MSVKKLRMMTDARVSLEKAGGSLSTQEVLDFKEDHALARDAVWAELNSDVLMNQLQVIGLEAIELSSQAGDRRTFIKRPDLGRKLSLDSKNLIKKRFPREVDLSISIADGLSAQAVELHAVNLLKSLLPMIETYSLAPVTVVKEGRVAISDEIGEAFHSKLAIILIGERPGLSSSDSLGIYLTYNPSSGNTDEKRNCISNIRDGGLSYEFAAQKLNYLISESIRRKISGVEIKDEFNANQLVNDKG